MIQRAPRRFNHRIDPDETLMDSVSSFSGYEVEGRMERPLGALSGFVFLALVVVGIGYLGWRAGFLQVASGEALYAQAQKNRFVTRTIYPPRGIIYDRSRTPVVDNAPSFGLVFEKGALLSSGRTLGEVTRALSAVLGKDKEFFAEIGIPEDGDPARIPLRLVISRDVPLETVIALGPRLDEMPGVQIVESYRRVYAHPFAGSHVLGYVGKISPEDLARDPTLGVEEGIGKTGIEASYDRILRGTAGKKIIETDAAGAETRFRFTQEPREGSSLLLTLDGELQKNAYDVVRGYTQGRTGASVVIVDVRTGAVRALVSSPGYDANKFSSSLGRAEFDAIVQNPLTPLFNRAIAGEFPSGSTIKPLVGAAVLEEKIIDPEKQVYDPGYIEIENPYKPGESSVFRDWRAHGWVNFSDAIAVSANVYFYIVGGGYRDQPGLGIEKLKQYAAAFGLGERLGIDLPGEKPGSFPTPESKKITDPGDPVWRVGDTYNVSIGQGGVRTTPLQMAAATAAIANGGTLWRPYLVDAALDREGTIAEQTAPQALRERIVSAETLERVKAGMRQAVTRGTAGRLLGLPVAVAAKTGTAQAGSGLPHAWVTGFVPFENPEIAFAVMVEHAGEGSTVAVPITRDILEWYFSR